MNLLHKKKQEEFDDDLNYYNNTVLRDIQNFKEEENVKLQAKQNNILTIRNIYEREMEIKQRNLKNEREKRNQEDKYYLECNNKLIENDLLHQKKLKLQQQEMNKKILLENEENKKKKLLMKQKEIEENLRIMKEYEMKLDREAKEREDLFNKRLKELEKYGQKFMLEGAGKKANDDLIKFEQFLLSEQRKKDEEDRRNEELKEKKRKELMSSINSFNQQQLEIKKKLKLDQKYEDQRYIESLKNDLKSFEQEEKDKKNQLKTKRYTYFQDLNNQVSNYNKYVRKNLDEITPVEKSINKDTLVNLEKDPNLLSNVLKCMRISDDNKKDKFILQRPY